MRTTTVNGKRKCSKCGKRKPLGSFRKREAGRYRSHCNTCRAKEKNRYYYDNQPSILKREAGYRKKKRKWLRERQRQWRLDHPKRYAEIHAKWKAANKAKVNSCTRRRRALIANAGGSFTEAEFAALKEKYDGFCLWCEVHESEVPLLPDHVIPLSRGGSNTIDNIQPLCHECNLQKGNKLGLDFRPLWEKRKTNDSSNPTSTCGV